MDYCVEISESPKGELLAIHYEIEGFGRIHSGLTEFSPSEVQLSKVSLRIFFIRHAQAKVYADDLSDLTDDGYSRVVTFGENLIQRLIEECPETTAIKLYHSGTVRTKVTAYILHRIFLEGIKNLGAWHIKMYSPHELRILDADRTLAPFWGTGSSKEQAYIHWLKAKPDEYVSISANSPAVIHRRMSEFLEQKAKLLRKIGALASLVMLCVTHETTLGALLSPIDPEVAEQIDFLDMLEVSKIKDKWHYRFKGKEYPL